LDDEAIDAELNVREARDWSERTENRNFNTQAGELGGRDAGETRIGAAGRDGRARDRHSERIVGFDVPDAPAELGVGAQRDKRTREARGRAGQLRLAQSRAGHVRGKSVAGNPEEPLPIGFACHDLQPFDPPVQLETST
jgi:hypothetical protein